MVVVVTKFYEVGEDPVAQAIRNTLAQFHTVYLSDEEAHEAANAARDACCRELLAHMDEHAPQDSPSPGLARLRRHLRIAVQVISPKPTAEEVAERMQQYLPEVIP